MALWLRLGNQHQACNNFYHQRRKLDTKLFLDNGIAAIVTASIITYGFRLGGLLLADQLPKSGPLRNFLSALPGTILVSLVFPSALLSGWQGILGVGACLAVYYKTQNLLLTMVGGVFMVYCLRLLC